MTKGEGREGLGGHRRTQGLKADNQHTPGSQMASRGSPRCPIPAQATTVESKKDGLDGDNRQAQLPKQGGTKYILGPQQRDNIRKRPRHLSTSLDCEDEDEEEHNQTCKNLLYSQPQ